MEAMNMSWAKLAWNVDEQSDEKWLSVQKSNKIKEADPGIY
jgi:hypothetical protein